MMRPHKIEWNDGTSGTYSIYDTGRPDKLSADNIMAAVPFGNAKSFEFCWSDVKHMD